MKLYYSPGACSLASHIALREAGVAFDLEKVDLGTKTTEKGANFAKINPKGYVPALELDNGQVLTEGVAIMQYAADQRPSMGLAPANGTMERYKLQEWMNFVATELHKGFGPLWNPKTPAEYKVMVKESLAKRFKGLDEHLGKHPYLMDKYSIADGYAFTILSWAAHADVSLEGYNNVKAYMGRVAARPKVHESLQAEGLLG